MRPEILDKINASPATQVNLSGMAITDDEMHDIMTLIKKERPSLESILLDHNQIADEGAKIIARFGASMNKLVEIDVQFNQIAESGAQALLALRARVALNSNLVHDAATVHEFQKGRNTYKF